MRLFRLFFVLSTALLLFILYSCNKDILLDAEEEQFQSEKPPQNVEPYLASNYIPEEQVRIAISQRIGEKIRKDPAFKKALFDQLVYKKARATKDYFVLDFLDDNFNGQTGAQILDGEKDAIRDRSSDFEIDIADYVMNVTPDLVLKMPQYVKAFFWAEEVAEEDLSIFTEAPFAVYAETSAPNAQGYFVGYGDTTTTFVDGIYGVQQGGAYIGHIPIHVKKSRRHVILNAQNESPLGIPLNEHIRSCWTPESLNCYNNALQNSTVNQSFLTNGNKLVNYEVLMHELGNCIRTLSPNTLFCGGPTVDPPNPPTSVEDCDNGIDDDGDGLIDEEDPDCMPCHELADYYRDCDEDENIITGARFLSPHYYFEIVNQLLPSIEDNINLRFDMFYLLNIDGCNSNCEMDESYDMVAKPALAFATFGEHNDITLYTTEEGTPENIFEDYYSEHLNNEGHFIAIGLAKHFMEDMGSDWIDYTFPQKRRLGSAYIENNSELLDLEIYLVNTSWVNTDGGISYMDFGSNSDWDPSLYGDIISVRVSETDPFSVLSQEQEGSIEQNNQSFTIGISGTVGKKQGASYAPNASYSFSDAEVKQASKTYSLNAERNRMITSFNFSYTDNATDDLPINDNDFYTAISIGRSDDVAIGSINEDINDLFFMNTSGKVHVKTKSSIEFIDLIKVE